MKDYSGWFYRVLAVIWAFMCLGNEPASPMYMMDIGISTVFCCLAEYCERTPKP